MARLARKIALITGAARGIGAAIPAAFRAKGAHVVLTDIRDELGQAAAARFRAHAEYHRLNVRLAADWRSGAPDAMLTATGPSAWGQVRCA